jgi:hypothetical protein
VLSDVVASCFVSYFDVFFIVFDKRSRHLYVVRILFMRKSQLSFDYRIWFIYSGFMFFIFWSFFGLNFCIGPILMSHPSTQYHIHWRIYTNLHLCFKLKLILTWASKYFLQVSFFYDHLQRLDFNFHLVMIIFNHL